MLLCLCLRPGSQYTPPTPGSQYTPAQQAHLGPLKEPDGLLPGSDDRPGDIVLPHWDNGRDVCLDVCVVSPQQAALVQQAAREGGGDVAVNHAFKAKMRKYEDRCAAEGLSFLPLAVDSYGGWHPRSLEALTKLGRQVARVVGKREDEAVMQLRQRAAVLHVRDTAAGQLDVPMHTVEVTGVKC